MSNAINSLRANTNFNIYAAISVTSEWPSEHPPLSRETEFYSFGRQQ